MLNFDPNQVVIYALVFVLGLLVGGFLFTGGGRKWKSRYNAEVDRRKEIEARHVAAEKDWREQDSLRVAAERDRERERARVAAAAPVAAAVPVVDRRDDIADRRDPLVSDRRDVNRDGVVTPDEKPAGFVDRMLGRDRDGDGIKDSREGFVDRDGDGIDDRRE